LAQVFFPLRDGIIAQHTPTTAVCPGTMAMDKLLRLMLFAGHCC
jgi:hypothetical protein